MTIYDEQARLESFHRQAQRRDLAALAVVAFAGSLALLVIVKLTIDAAFAVCWP